MKCNNRFLLCFPFFALLLISCDSHSTISRLFSDKYFAKWVRDDNEITLICQGYCWPFEGRVLFEGDDELYNFSLSFNYSDSEILFIFKDDITFSYFLQKESNTTFIATEVETDEKHIFTYTEMVEEEINLRYLINTDLKSKELEDTIFTFDERYINESSYRWKTYYNKNYYYLYFLDNRAFEIKPKYISNETIYGTYNPNFESVILTFENEGGYFGLYEIEFYYYNYEYYNHNF